MPTITKATTFGFAEADLVTPGATPIYTRILGVTSADWASEMESVEVTGDDTVLTYWNHGQKGSLTIKGHVIDLEVIEAITGNLYQEEEQNNRAYVYGGTVEELKTKEFMLCLRQNAKEPTSGTPCVHQIIFFRCTGNVKLSGMSYGEPTEVEINVSLLQATKDEKNQSIEPAMWREEFVVEGD